MRLTPLVIASFLIVLASTMAMAQQNSLAKGIALYNAARYSEALRYFAEAQNQAQQVPKALYYRALVELQLKKTTEAADTLRALVRLAPDSAEAASAKQYLQKLEYARAAAATPRLPRHIKIPYRTESDGWMHVDGKVNGQDVDFVWDTGATHCSLPLNVAGDPPDNATRIKVETPHGVEHAFVLPVEITVGTLKRKVMTTVLGDVAVIGQSFFSDYKVEFNKDTRNIYLDYVGTAASTTSNKNKTSKFQVPFEREGGIIVVDIDINGERVKSYFDTGCAAQGIAMSSTAAAGRRYVDVVIGPISRKRVPVTIANGMSRPLVGPAIFGDRSYKIDPAHQVIDFDYSRQ